MAGDDIDKKYPDGNISNNVSVPIKSDNKTISSDADTKLEGNFEQNKLKQSKNGKEKLHTWLNKSLKIEMSDGRILIGNFLCTDRDANVILGACTEFLNPEVCGFSDEPRILGLVMVPGRHIVSMHLEVPTNNNL